MFVPLFAFAGMTDYLDGMVARRYNMLTKSGKIIDPTADKLLILIPLAVFSSLGLYSPWWLVPIFFREIVITFCRVGWYLEGRAAGAEQLGKIKFVSQLALIVISFIEFIGRGQSWIQPYSQGISGLLSAGLWVSLVLTLVSGATFLKSNRDNFSTPFFSKYVSAAGVGLIPFAPGTWGSALGLIIAWLCSFNPVLYAAVFLFIFGASYAAVNRLDLSQMKDPGYVVMDEVCGMFLTLFLIPFSWQSMLIGFFLFRFFDILKPFPVRSLEKLPGFWGIMMDDLGAGIYSWISLQLILHWIG